MKVLYSEQRLIRAACAALCCSSLLCGCMASLTNGYFVKAYDPFTDSTNFYSVEIKGTTFLSKTKFSVGFFDKTAVDRLFGEDSVSREYLSTAVDNYGSDGQRLTDLSNALSKADTAQVKYEVGEQLSYAATLQELVSKYQARVQLIQAAPSAFHTSLTDAQSAITSAVAQLGAPLPALAEARINLRKAWGLVEAVRMALDGRVIVQFLDGAGNPIEVNSKVQLIFVATDSSRFTSALRTLVESNETQQEMLQIVLGPKILEAARLKDEITAQNNDLKNRLATLSSKADEMAQKKATAEDARRIILEAATSLAGAVAPFKNEGEVRVYADHLP